MARYLYCDTDKYGNFSKGYYYQVFASSKNLATKELNGFYIDDNDGDKHPVASLSRTEFAYIPNHVVDLLTHNYIRPHVPQILECSTKGDSRFSAYHANVSVYGVVDSIENHYQQSKVFQSMSAGGGIVTGLTPKRAKELQKAGWKPIHFQVHDYDYPIEMLSMYYDLLWKKYLDMNPNLVEFLKQFDDYSDIFKGKNTINCQADSIRRYMQLGSNGVCNMCASLIHLFNHNNDLRRRKQA